MGNALGIASVTHVIKDLLNDGLINQNVSEVLDTAIRVSSLPPGQLEGSNDSIQSQLNFFMFRVSTNSGWSNIGYPSRNGRGDITGNPPLALDLHYLLTAFGEDELHAEILLGYGMQLLHENPVLGRELIQHSLSPATVDDPDGRLPTSLLQLSISGLADQIEQIKITPDPINTEELSKLWSAFQTRYRPCAAYKVTVILIESSKSVIAPLPVTNRNVYVFPFRNPTIHKIASQRTESDPISKNRSILVNNFLILKGNQLKSPGVFVKIGDLEIILDETDIRDNQLRFQLLDTYGLKAGIHGIQVIQPLRVGIPPDEREFKGASSNLQAFVLSPEILNSAVTTGVIANGNLISAEIELEVRPHVHPGQRVILLLNQIDPDSGTDPVSYSFPLSSSLFEGTDDPIDTLHFEANRIRPGSYLLRIQVDGAASPLFTNTSGEFDSPQINIS